MHTTRDLDVALATLPVLDTTIAYRGQGQQGPTVLFLHGNPTSSYIWRHVLPHVSRVGTCVAPDLVGFGQSGKPNSAYRFADHARYLEALLDTLHITSTYVVAQDWGTALALDLAARRPSLVAGLALMEFIAPAPTWADFHQTDVARDLFRQLRTPGIGEALIQERNVFVEGVLPRGVVRPLTTDECRAYAQPFATPESRRPIWRLVSDLPIAGEPADVADRLGRAWESFRQSHYPKLLFAADPGALVTLAQARDLAGRLTNCRLVDLGPGRHYLQEDHPHTIGQSVADWVVSSESRQRRHHMGRVTITYCQPCGYARRAQAAAAELERRLGVSAKLVAGRGGVYEVAVDGAVVTRRAKGSFPEAADVAEAVARALGQPARTRIPSVHRRRQTPPDRAQVRP